MKSEYFAGVIVAAIATILAMGFTSVMYGQVNMTGGNMTGGNMTGGNATTAGVGDSTGDDNGDDGEDDGGEGENEGEGGGSN